MNVETSIIELLQESRIEDNGIFLAGNLDRKTYTDVNKVIEAMGGKWDRKKGCHYFKDQDPRQLLDQIIATGEVVSEKQEFQFFETPEEVIDMMNLQIVSIMGAGTRVLEPSAGSGNIVRWLRDYYETTGIEIDCCEINPRLNTILDSHGFNVVAADFLSFNPSHLYDVIIANPPFSKCQDIDHVMHMFDCLKVGGILVSVMSAGVLFRTDKKTKAFRQFVEDNDGGFDEIRPGAFKESGTMVNSCFVTIHKHKPN